MLHSLVDSADSAISFGIDEIMRKLLAYLKYSDEFCV